MRIWHNMNIIVQNTGGDESPLNSKSESPNKTLNNITRVFLIKSSHKKELWLFAYQYSTWISLWTDNRLRGDVPYFICHGSLPSYKHIKILFVRVSIINGGVTRNKVYDRSHHGYFMGYEANTVFIIYYNID